MARLHHDCVSPFPFKRGGDVVDEICRCQHRRSMHFDTVAYGHGECSVIKCPCTKFTWASDLVAAEGAKVGMSRRPRAGRKAVR